MHSPSVSKDTHLIFYSTLSTESISSLLKQTRWRSMYSSPHEFQLHELALWCDSPQAVCRHVHSAVWTAGWVQSSVCRAWEGAAAPASDQSGGTGSVEAECTALDTPHGGAAGGGRTGNGDQLLMAETVLWGGLTKVAFTHICCTVF